MRATSRDVRVVSKRCVAGWPGCGQVSWIRVHLAARAGPKLPKHAVVTTGRGMAMCAGYSQQRQREGLNRVGLLTTVSLEIGNKSKLQPGKVIIDGCEVVDLAFPGQLFDFPSSFFSDQKPQLTKL